MAAHELKDRQRMCELRIRSRTAAGIQSIADELKGIILNEGGTYNGNAGDSKQSSEDRIQCDDCGRPVPCNDC